MDTKPGRTTVFAKGISTTSRGDVKSTQSGVRDRCADTRPSRDEIANRAYFIWRSKGCPAGTSEQDWLDAEAQLTREMKRRS